ARPKAAEPNDSGSGGEPEEAVPDRAAATASPAPPPGARRETARVNLVDALTGEPVAGTWSIGVRAGVLGEAAPPLREGGAAGPDLRTRGGGRGGALLTDVAVWGWPAGEARCTWDAPGDLSSDGLAADATSVRLDVPIYRRASLQLTVLAPDGRPAEGA